MENWKKAAQVLNPSFVILRNSLTVCSSNGSGKRTNASNRAASEIIMPVDGSHFNDDTCDEELDTAPAITLLRSSFGKATDAGTSVQFPNAICHFDGWWSIHVNP